MYLSSFVSTVLCIFMVPWLLTLSNLHGQNDDVLDPMVAFRTSSLLQSSCYFLSSISRAKRRLRSFKLVDIQNGIENKSAQASKVHTWTCCSHTRVNWPPEEKNCDETECLHLKSRT